MPINVTIRCSDCGELTEKTLKAGDTEIICPECQRVMPNLSKEDFKNVEKTLGTQRILAIIALVCFAAAIALLVLYAGDPSTWPTAAKNRLDNPTYLYGAGGALLLCAIFGCLSARTRYVVEF